VTRAAARSCRLCRRPLIRMDLVAPGKRLPLFMCGFCDKGPGLDVGPPVLIDYLRKGSA
jgi:hypothetical protein